MRIREKNGPGGAAKHPARAKKNPNHHEGTLMSESTCEPIAEPMPHRLTADELTAMQSRDLATDEMLALVAKAERGPEPGETCPASGETRTADEFRQIVMRWGRVNGPAILIDHYAGGHLTDDDLARCIGDIWSMAEYPETAIDADEWRDMFETAGYTVDGHPATPPARIRLYRGAAEDRRDGMAWTSDRAVAERFATGSLNGRTAGRLYTAEVEGWRLYCHHNGRDEAEYVIDTDGLHIEEDEL